MIQRLNIMIKFKLFILITMAMSFLFMGLFEKPAWSMGIYYISIISFLSYMFALFIKLADYTREPDFQFGPLYIMDAILVSFSVILVIIFNIIWGVYISSMLIVITVALTTFSFDRYDD